MCKLLLKCCDHCGKNYNYLFKAFFKYFYKTCVISSVTCPWSVNLKSTQVNFYRSVRREKLSNIRTTSNRAEKATRQRNKSEPKIRKSSSTQSCITHSGNINSIKRSLRGYQVWAGWSGLQLTRKSWTKSDIWWTESAHHQLPQFKKMILSLFFSAVCCGSGDPATWRIQQPRHLLTVSA